MVKTPGDLLACHREMSPISHADDQGGITSGLEEAGDLGDAEEARREECAEFVAGADRPGALEGG